MVRTLIWLVILLLATPAYAEWKFNPFTGKQDYYEPSTTTPTVLNLTNQAEPTLPDPGESILWISNGTGIGSAGDLVLVVNVGGTAKYSILKKWNSAIASLPVYNEIPYVQFVDGTFLQMVDGTYLEWVTAP